MLAWFSLLHNGCLLCPNGCLHDGMVVSPLEMVVLMMEWLSLWWNGCLPYPHGCLPDGLVFPPVGMIETSHYPPLVKNPVQPEYWAVDQVYPFPPGDAGPVSASSTLQSLSSSHEATGSDSKVGKLGG